MAFRHYGASLGFVLILFLGACGGQSDEGGNERESTTSRPEVKKGLDPGKAKQEILASMEKAAEGWNEGDLDRHFAKTAKSITYITAEGLKTGRSDLKETLRQAYFSDGASPLRLRYETLQVRLLGRKHALLTGRFVLSAPDQADQSGWFTTLWEYSKGSWKMIHDHSS